jgi:hypothetical protein
MSRPKDKIIANVEMIAAVVGGLAIILGGARWLAGTEFVSKDAFAEHQKVDLGQIKTAQEQFRQIHDYMIWDCAFKAAGNGVVFDSCRRMLVPEK